MLTPAETLRVRVACALRLQVGKPGRQILTEGDPPALLAPQRTASAWYRKIKGQGKSITAGS
ncbi:hypothetical protein [Brasilonema sennae]|uniref:hypothetical protein n=1 Tax=Brasilonema sennae TaxID=1397703 RepID=UPI0015571A4A|nr:hypothetical protein [Brasilonema sennae]